MASKELSILLLAKDMASKTIGKVSKEVGRLGRAGAIASRGVTTLAGNLAKLGAVAAVGIGAAVTQGIQSLSRIEDINAQTEAAIASTGGAANVSASQIAALAEGIENLTTTEAESVQEAANLLLTFTKVRNEVGEGNDIFNQATEAVVDLSVALGQDATSSAMQLGKALNDPVRGMATLRRSGIQFTADQEKLVKALVESGDVMGAQKVILAELNTQFGGRAASQADTYGGKIRALGHAWGTLQETLAEALIPVLGEVATELQKMFKDKAVMDGVKAFGTTLAEGFRSLVGIVKNLPWGQIGQSLQIAAGAARAILDAFVSLPPWVQAAVLTGWGLNKLTGGALGSIVGELGKGLIKGVLGMTAGVVHLKAATVIGGPGGPAGNVVGTGAKVAGAGAALAAGGIATIAALGAAAAITAIESNNAKYGGKGLSEAEIRALKWSKMSEEERAVSRKRGYGAQGNQAALLASALAKLNAKPVVLGPPTPAYAALMERITAKGGIPTAERVKAIMEKNAATTKASLAALGAKYGQSAGMMIAAANATTAAVRAIDVRPQVNVNTGFTVNTYVSVRDQRIATRVHNSYQGGSTAGGTVVAS